MEKRIKIGTCSSCKTEGTIYLDTGLCMVCDKRDRVPVQSEYEKASDILKICGSNAIPLDRYSGEVQLSDAECFELTWNHPFTLDEIKNAFWDGKT